MTAEVKIDPEEGAFVAQPADTNTDLIQVGQAVERGDVTQETGNFIQAQILESEKTK